MGRHGLKAPGHNPAILDPGLAEIGHQEITAFVLLAAIGCRAKDDLDIAFVVCLFKHCGEHLKKLSSQR
jgi:hypothetical protein